MTFPQSKYLNNVFSNPSFVAHSKWPSDEENAWENDLCRKFVPPRADVLGVADEEGPFAMILDVEVVVDTAMENNILIKMFLRLILA